MIPQPDRTLPARMASIRPGLERYLLALTGEPDCVDDLVQETLLRLIERLDRLRAPEDLERFARGIGRLVARERHRRRRRPRCLDPGATGGLIDQGHTPIATASRAEERAALCDAIESLPIVARRMLEMRYREGLNASQIGTLLGCSSSAVRVTLQRTRERLRSRVSGPRADLRAG